MFQHIAGDLFILFLILLALQEVAVSPHPGKRLAAAVRAPGDQFRRDRDTVTHRLYHSLHRLHGVPGVVGTADSTLEEAVIALNFRYLVLRVKLDKLGVLVGSQHKEVLAFQQSIQVEIGLAHRGGLGGVQEGGEISPEGGPVIPLAEHPIKSALEMILLRKLAEVFAEGGVVLIVEVTAPGGRQAGSPAHHNAVGIPNLLRQPHDLLVIRQGFFVGQLIRRAAGSIDVIIFGVIHLGLHDQILVKTHGHHSFLLVLVLFLLQFILTPTCTPVNMLL